MREHWKQYVLVFLGSLVLTVVALVVLQLQPTGYAALSRCTETDISSQKPSCVSALQDSLNVHFVACSADKELLPIGDKIDNATISVAMQYAQQKGFEISENLASQVLIDALKNDTISCKLTPAVAVIDSATVTRYETNSSNQISETVVTVTQKTSSVDQSENTKIIENANTSTGTGSGSTSGSSPIASSGDSKVSPAWMELGTVYPEYATKRSTVKLYACRQSGSVKTKYTVLSTSFSPETQFRFAVTDSTYTVLYKYSANTVKSGVSYESADSYNPTVRFHPGVYIGSGDTASWSYLQKSFSLGDISACA